jgi:hypothetical protein
MFWLFFFGACFACSHMTWPRVFVWDQGVHAGWMSKFEHPGDDLCHCLILLFRVSLWLKDCILPPSWNSLDSAVWHGPNSLENLTESQPECLPESSMWQDVTPKKSNIFGFHYTFPIYFVPIHQILAEQVGTAWATNSVGCRIDAKCNAGS